MADAAFTVAHRFHSPNAAANLADLIFGLDFPLSFPFLIASDVIGFLVIAGTFWYLAQERHMLRPSRRAIAVLAFQTITALLLSPGLNYIGSAQAGFLFPLRGGLLWVFVQSSVEIAVTFIYPSMGEWMLPPTMQGLSGATLWTAIAAATLVYHFLAFSLGYLGANAVRQSVELRRKNAELEATQQLESDAARLAERFSIARDLHDELGHHLTALSLHLQLASKQTEGEARETVDAAYLLARTVLSDIRGTVTDLRAAQPIDLPKALALLAGGIAFPKIHLNIGENFELLDPLPCHALFRSTQETITNAVRHASARNLWIDLRCTPAAYELNVRDDGQGVDPLVLGNGLRGLVERIENLNGHVSFKSKPSMQVVVYVPRNGVAREAA